ncbi:phytanoyl-CoA dioxygenase family protein [Legionella resiliens]|uniref:Phytanoyl-CoA dioxygenase family protein n=1 Tax=Legionella resiliens TaxID=2905958 RepID=A0ABS8WZT1_9GAMM|nr:MULTISPECIES: phytanoyl-CoA dioxygenase family protein [unclassified Legionella]MCE0721872.1 phytanoyl-CoA dioxygenase family protein [Legionella sp. 9fVS26]MCE3531026.1 phytanoyl-CoA dioxygenase family protein [Legionella sp. 8cVS16]
MKTIANSNALTEYNLYDLQSDLKQAVCSYDKNGIIVLKDYINQAELTGLLSEIELIQHDAELDIAQNWDNEIVCFYSKNPLKQESEPKEYVTQPYFQASNHKGHVFYEVIDNVRVVNRIGHGMHLIEKYSMMQQTVYRNPMLMMILKGIGYRRPICHLSVYIPKYPYGSGSEVRPHQESTFAYTEPTSVAVLWLALENACIENACMYGIMGSNHWPLKWVSRVSHQLKTRQFEPLNDVYIPDFITENYCYTPLEVKAGDALLFHGNFVHCSPVNYSSCSRKALSFQFIETVGVNYSKSNWLQPPNQANLY